MSYKQIEILTPSEKNPWYNELVRNKISKLMFFIVSELARTLDFLIIYLLLFKSNIFSLHFSFLTSVLARIQEMLMAMYISCPLFSNIRTRNYQFSFVSLKLKKKKEKKMYLLIIKFLTNEMVKLAIKKKLWKSMQF